MLGSVITLHEQLKTEISVDDEWSERLDGRVDCKRDVI